MPILSALRSITLKLNNLVLVLFDIAISLHTESLMSGILFPTALSYHQLWQVLSVSSTLLFEFCAMMLRFYFFLLVLLLQQVCPCLN